ncbi:MAG: ATP phosphoribosyltransferase [Spirochaetales bacterium]|nr:ATP phosphoribosyltransferase [Spirochaetales bacterium]
MTVTIALPKGRLFEKTNNLLSQCGYELSLGERHLVATEASGTLRAILVKNSDLPTYVHHGIAGLGICGSDVIYESGYEFFELLKLPFGKTRICLAGRKDDGADHREATSLTVASKFTRFSRDYFHTRGIPVEVIRLDGSVELAPVLGLAPYIVDLVETGSTLRAHNLEVKETLGETEVRLVANPAFYKYHYQIVDAFVHRLASVL